MDLETVRSAMSPFRKPRPYKSLWQVLNTLGPYLGLWALMYGCLSVSYWLVLALAVPAAGLVVRLFIIQHDCGHHSFFKSRVANRAVGRLCSLFTLAPFAHWQRQHAGHHANWNNLSRRASGADIYSTCLTVAEYRALTAQARLRYRIVRHPMVALIILPPLIFLLLYRVAFDTPPAWIAERRSVWLTNGALLALFTTIGAVIGFRDLILIQLPITIVATIAGVWLFSLQHRFHSVTWFSADDWSVVAASLRGTSYLRLPRILQWFTGNIGFHHIHHLDTRIPNYQLQKCHNASAAAKSAPVLTLWQGLYASRFPLWDEQRSRMVGFPV